MNIQLLFSILGQTEFETESWWSTIEKGGTVGYIILGLSLIALSLAVMHFVQIRRTALLPEVQLTTLEQLLANGETQEALEYCVDPSNDTYLTRILATGLLRYQRSAGQPWAVSQQNHCVNKTRPLRQIVTNRFHRPAHLRPHRA